MNHPLVVFCFLTGKQKVYAFLEQNRLENLTALADSECHTHFCTAPPASAQHNNF